MVVRFGRGQLTLTTSSWAAGCEQQYHVSSLLKTERARIPQGTEESQEKLHLALPETPKEGVNLIPTGFLDAKQVIHESEIKQNLETYYTLML